ncbi:MAG: competence/damage-inducible protein A [Vicinamibacterales bacterium]
MSHSYRRAAILAVGSELLTPSRVDTNSLHITAVLNELGIDVVYKGVVGDDRTELARQVRAALEAVDLLLLTGGLGPTDDDVTREVVAAVLGRPLHEDAAILARIEKRFESRGWRMPAVNRRQAQVPEGAVVLANPNGTAPGLWLEHEGRGIALLPGPPREMQPMLAGLVEARLTASAGRTRLRRRVLKIVGRTESRVEELTQPVYSTWLTATPPIETTILAAPGLIELHLSARGEDLAELEAALERAVGQIAAVMGADLFSRDGQSLEEVVGELLRARGWHIGLAESCTGGLATSRLTDVPGSSEYVERSVVVYSNAAKEELLGVPAALIAANGAVSEPVASAMAEGIRRVARTEVGVGITGIAGPGGGSEEKPVGTVCIAVAAEAGSRVRTFRFPGNRELVKAFSALTAIDMVRRLLLDAAADPDWVRR